jgi:ABC-type glycerol-3-phosphate transport system permease component
MIAQDSRAGRLCGSGSGDRGAAIFAVTRSWNEFPCALVFIQNERAITVPAELNRLSCGGAGMGVIA